LPTGSLARLNQAGDLAGSNNSIYRAALEETTLAARDRKVFTYTHKPVLGETPVAIENRAAIAKANAADNQSIRQQSLAR
jgi:hypothetical protein